MKTKNGIEFDLKKSNYYYKTKQFTFYFSSEFYRNKFKKELQSYVEMENSKIIAKYKININLIDYFAISLYKKIEKRGFLVQAGYNYYKDVTFICSLQ